MALLAPAPTGRRLRAQWVLMVGELKKMLPARLGRGMQQQQSIAFAERELGMRVAGRLEQVLPPHQLISLAVRALVMRCFQQVFPEMSRRVWVQLRVE